MFCLERNKKKDIGKSVSSSKKSTVTFTKITSVKLSSKKTMEISLETSRNATSQAKNTCQINELIRMEKQGRRILKKEIQRH